MAVHEAYLYDRSKPIFKAFLKVLAREKIRHSGLPDHLVTNEQKIDYVQTVNQEMGFHGTDELAPTDFQKNTLLRTMYKLQSNALLGKPHDHVKIKTYVFLHICFFKVNWGKTALPKEKQKLFILTWSWKKFFLIQSTTFPIITFCAKIACI